MDRKQRQAAAERMTRAATLKMAFFGAAFLVWQILFFTILPDQSPSLRKVDIVRTVAFLAWSLALLLLFATGGTMFRARQIREFVNDERTQALRATSYRIGFWAMIAACFAAYAASMMIELRGLIVAHLLLSTGIIAVLGSQLILERR